MPDQPDSYDFVYVDTDIPAGMTIREWRRQRATERIAQRKAERDARRRTLWMLALGAGVTRVARRARRGLALRGGRRHAGREIPT
jgi:hypothetical protein